jgi:hypothetical protein
MKRKSDLPFVEVGARAGQTTKAGIGFTTGFLTDKSRCNKVSESGDGAAMERRRGADECAPTNLRFGSRYDSREMCATSRQGSERI